MKIHYLILFTLLIGLIVGFVAGVKADNIDQAQTRSIQDQEEEPIRIGAIFMLSGAGSFWGENSKLGAELAVTEINDMGGINGRPIEIVYEDNQGDNPKQALSALNKFIFDGIDIFIGPNWSPSGLAIAPVACKNRVLGISPTLGLADFNEECDFLFNLWVHDDIASNSLGSFTSSTTQGLQ